MNTSKYTKRTSDFHMGTPGMRWDPDHNEWVWPERLPAYSSWFDPQPFLDVKHVLGYGTPDLEGQRSYARVHGEYKQPEKAKPVIFARKSHPTSGVIDFERWAMHDAVWEELGGGPNGNTFRILGL